MFFVVFYRWCATCRVPHEYLRLRDNATPVSDPQNGTACPHLRCIPIIKCDKLRQKPTLKYTFFVINPELKFAIFYTY